MCIVLKLQDNNIIMFFPVNYCEFITQCHTLHVFDTAGPLLVWRWQAGAQSRLEGRGMAVAMTTLSWCLTGMEIIF